MSFHRVGLTTRTTTKREYTLPAGHFEYALGNLFTIRSTPEGQSFWAQRRCTSLFFSLYFFSRLILRVAPLNGLISECLIIQEQRKWHWDLDLVDNNGAIKGLDPSSLSLHEPKRRFRPSLWEPKSGVYSDVFFGECLYTFLSSHIRIYPRYENNRQNK